MSDNEACLLSAIKALKAANTTISANANTVIASAPGLFWGKNETSVTDVLSDIPDARGKIAQIAADRVYNQCMTAQENLPNIAPEKARIR